MIASSGFHTMALKDDGFLFGWGSNTYQQIVNRTDKYIRDPIFIMAQIIDVCVGEYHSVVVDANGEYKSFGRNDYGQLGDGTNINRKKPVKYGG